MLPLDFKVEMPVPRRGLLGVGDVEDRNQLFTHVGSHDFSSQNLSSRFGGITAELTHPSPRAARLMTGRVERHVSHRVRLRCVHAVY